ncbi:MAG: hypothetical protein H8E66_05905 [Planctomycetes bacterium]|nr:hypothetical protein [Planctomycetota bacterium]
MLKTAFRFLQTFVSQVVSLATAIKPPSNARTNRSRGQSFLVTRRLCCEALEDRRVFAGVAEVLPSADTLARSHVQEVAEVIPGMEAEATSCFIGVEESACLDVREQLNSRITTLESQISQYGSNYRSETVVFHDDFGQWNAEMERVSGRASISGGSLMLAGNGVVKIPLPEVEDGQTIRVSTEVVIGASDRAILYYDQRDASGLTGYTLDVKTHDAARSHVALSTRLKNTQLDGDKQSKAVLAGTHQLILEVTPDNVRGTVVRPDGVVHQIETNVLDAAFKPAIHLYGWNGARFNDFKVEVAGNVSLQEMLDENRRAVEIVDKTIEEIYAMADTTPDLVNLANEGALSPSSPIDAVVHFTANDIVGSLSGSNDSLSCLLGSSATARENACLSVRDDLNEEMEELNSQVAIHGNDFLPGTVVFHDDFGQWNAEMERVSGRASISGGSLMLAGNGVVKIPLPEVEDGQTIRVSTEVVIGASDRAILYYDQRDASGLTGYTLDVKTHDAARSHVALSTRLKNTQLDGDKQSKAVLAGTHQLILEVTPDNVRGTVVRPDGVVHQIETNVLDAAFKPAIHLYGWNGARFNDFKVEVAGNVSLQEMLDENRRAVEVIERIIEEIRLPAADFREFQRPELQVIKMKGPNLILAVRSDVDQSRVRIEGGGIFSSGTLSHPGGTILSAIELTLNTNHRTGIYEVVLESEDGKKLDSLKVRWDANHRSLALLDPTDLLTEAELDMDSRELVDLISTNGNGHESDITEANRLRDELLVEFNELFASGDSVLDANISVGHLRDRLNKHLANESRFAVTPSEAERLLLAAEPDIDPKNLSTAVERLHAENPTWGRGQLQDRLTSRLSDRLTRMRRALGYYEQALGQATADAVNAIARVVSGTPEREAFEQYLDNPNWPIFSGHRAAPLPPGFPIPTNRQLLDEVVSQYKSQGLQNTLRFWHGEEAEHYQEAERDFQRHLNATFARMIENQSTYRQSDSNAVLIGVTHGAAWEQTPILVASAGESDSVSHLGVFIDYVGAPLVEAGGELNAIGKHFKAISRVTATHSLIQADSANEFQKILQKELLTKFYQDRLKTVGCVIPTACAAAGSFGASATVDTYYFIDGQVVPMLTDALQTIYDGGRYLLNVVEFR